MTKDRWFKSAAMRRGSLLFAGLLLVVMAPFTIDSARGHDWGAVSAGLVVTALAGVLMWRGSTGGVRFRGDEMILPFPFSQKRFPVRDVVGVELRDSSWSAWGRGVVVQLAGGREIRAYGMPVGRRGSASHHEAEQIVRQVTEVLNELRHQS